MFPFSLLNRLPNCLPSPLPPPKKKKKITSVWNNRRNSLQMYHFNALECFCFQFSLIFRWAKDKDWNCFLISSSRSGTHDVWRRALLKSEPVFELILLSMFELQPLIVIYFCLQLGNVWDLVYLKLNTLTCTIGLCWEGLEHFSYKS